MDGDAKKTVHIFATEAEADAFRGTLNDREVKRREEARFLRQPEEDGPLADIYELTGVKRRTKD